MTDNEMDSAAEIPRGDESLPPSDGDLGDQGLIHAMLLDGKGGARELNWSELQGWEPEQGALWLHFNYKHENTREWLHQRSGLNEVIVEALVAEDTRPRCLSVKGGILSILRGVNLAPDADEEMISLRMWLDEHRLITVRRYCFASVRDIKHYLEEGQGSKNPSDLFSDLVYVMLDKIGERLRDLDQLTEDLEERVLYDADRSIRKQLLDLRQQTISLRRYFAPMRDVLQRLPTEKGQALRETDRVHLRENADRMLRFVEDLDEIRERASIAQDELMTHINERMSKNTYVLSVVAAIFLPLGLLTGLLGINVGGIPGAENPWAFLGVCLLLVGMGVMQYFLYCKLQWI